MNVDNLTTDELKAQYEVTLARAATVAVLIAEHEKKLVSLQVEWSILQGSSWARRDGKVTQHKTLYLRSKLYDADKLGPPVFWQDIPKRTPRHDDWIVDKVTPKRIFIRRMGDQKTVQYKRDGLPVGSCFTDAYIDVGLTLKNYKGEVPPC